MKYILRPFYILYQYLIALPLALVLTVFTSIFTICLYPWRNTEFVHKEQQFWSKSMCRLMLLPVHVDGLEHIVPGQSYVFVSNHQSMFDVWVIYGWLPVVFKWLMKAELRKIPFVGTACKAAGHIFVSRKNAKASFESLQLIEKQLVNGVSTVIFPEGTRTKDGKLGRFKRGAFQIALDLKLPVIPISLSGCYEVMPKGAWTVHRHPIHMHVGEPINLGRFAEPQEAIEYVREKVALNIK